jgi:methanogenic corrinoid protein MtbC1
MSALLTNIMLYMKVVADELKSRDLRDRYIVLVGGAPVNEAFAEEIEADACCANASVAVNKAKVFLAPRQNGAS